MDKKVPSKFQFWHFRVLWGKFAKFLMSFSKQHVRFSSNFASLFNVIKMILLYFFSSNSIYFVQKYPIKVKIFEPFWCSGQNLSNSLCQFGNGKSIPLQILYPSLVSWKITPLYLFSSSNIDFAQKDTIKGKLFETFECSGQNLSNFLCQFWNDKSILLQILHHSSLSWNITPLWILSSFFFYFGLKDLIKIPILRLSSALVKIYHIPHVIFQTTSQFFFKLCITL